MPVGPVHDPIPLVLAAVCVRTHVHTLPDASRPRGRLLACQPLPADCAAALDLGRNGPG